MNRKLVYCLVLLLLCLAFEGMAQTYFLKDYKAETKHKASSLFPNGDPDDDHPDYHVEEGLTLPPLQAKTSTGEEWLYFRDATRIVDVVVSDQYIWSASHNGGLVRTDRASGTSMSFNDWTTQTWNYGQISDLLVDRNGGLWMATNLGIDYFDGVKWKHYRPGNDFELENLRWIGVDALAEDNDGNIWASGNDYIVFFDGENWYEQPFSAYQEIIQVGQDGGVWTISEDRHLMRWEAGTWDKITAIDNELISDYSINNFAVTKEGEVWLVAYYYDNKLKDMVVDLIRWNEDREMQIYHSRNGTTPADFYKVQLDAVGDLWFMATDCGGVFKWEKGDFVAWEHNELYECGSIVMEDETVWAYRNGQIREINTRKREIVANHIVTNAFLYNASNMLIDEENTKWFSSGHGYLVSLKGNEWTVDGLLTLPIEERRIHQMILAKQKGGVWLRMWSPSGSIYHYDGTDWTFIVEQPNDKDHTFIYEDEEGHLWVSNGMTLRKRINNEWKDYEVPAIEFVNHGIWSEELFTDMITDQQGQMWAITNSKRLFKYNPSTDAWDYILTLDEENALKGESFCYGYDPAILYTDNKGNLWANGERFLARYDGSNWEYFSDNTIDMACGIRAIVEDREGVLWIVRTHESVVKYDGETWEEVTPLNSGLQGNYIRTVNMDVEGNLWFLAQGGMSVYQTGGGKSIDNSFNNGLIDNPILVEYLDIYPNPLTNGTPLTIDFAMRETARGRIVIYNSVGQEVYRQQEGIIARGSHRLTMEGTLGSGVYFLLIQTDGGRLNKTFVVHE